MKIALSTLLLLTAITAIGQESIFYGADNGTINNCTTGCTSGDGDCFEIIVSGIGTLNTTTNGLTRICFSITGSRPRDYDIILKAPDGTTASLVNDAGSSSGTYNNGVCFTDFGPTGNVASWPGTIEEGNYQPNDLFSTTFNTPAINADGTWQICVRDDSRSGSDGTINFASLTFGTVAAEASPNGSTCANAVLVNPPFFRSNIDVGASPDNYDTGCSGVISGDDYVLEYTPPSDTYLSLTANYDATSNGPSVSIFDGCPDSGPSCVASDKMGTFDSYIRLTSVALTGGTTYYIVCSSDYTSHSENLDLEILVGERGNDDCSSATSIDNSNTYMGNNTLTIDPNGSQAPNLTTEMGCNGATNNFNYYTFNTDAAGTNVSLGIFDIDCGAGASGLQVSLFQSATPCITGSWGASIECESSVMYSDTYYDWTGLTPSTDYYVIIDGVAGDNCVWKMRMDGDLNIVLPIELLSFTAEKDGQDVQLSWITASETNNDFYTVELSADGISFQQIGQVEGAGNHAGTLQYSYGDYSPLSGRSYYRLKQTDYDGAFTYSAIKSVNFKSTSWNPYPNPANAGDILQISNKLDIQSIYLINMLGQSIDLGASNKVSLPDDLPFGTYFLQIIERNGQLSSKKLVVN